MKSTKKAEKEKPVDVKLYTNVVLRKTEELICYPNNAKKHPPRQIEKIITSIKSNGFSNPILIDKNDVIIAGHGRYLASKKLKLEQVPTICMDDLTEDQAKIFRIADNKVAESEWDEELLKVELEELYAENISIDLTGFDFSEYKNLLGEFYPVQIKEKNYEGTEEKYYSDEQTKKEIALSKDKLAVPFWDWMNNMNEIYCLFSGGKDSMAVFALLLDNIKDKSKIKIFHNMIPMDLPSLDVYVKEFAKNAGVECIMCVVGFDDQQLYRLLRKSGVPLNYAKRWCLRVWKMLPTNKYIKEHGLDKRNDIVFVEGLRREEGGTRETAEERAIRKNDNVRIARPLLEYKEAEVFEIITKKGWKRHWIYDSGFPRLGCIFCFATNRRDWAIMREKHPEIFIKALRILAEGACSDNIAGSDVVYYLRKMLSLDTVVSARKEDGLPPRKPWTGDRKRTDD